MPFRHVLKQVELYAGRRKKRDVRPAWLVRLVELVAELFEPFEPVARVGFECALADDVWTVALYLGAAEIVGGPFDGRIVHANFTFDVRRLVELFDRVDELSWTALPEPEPLSAERADAGRPKERSFLTVLGTFEGHPVRVSVFSVPLENAGPALRKFADGTCEPV